LADQKIKKAAVWQGKKQEGQQEDRSDFLKIYF
jgi:hypothetical protein